MDHLDLMEPLKDTALAMEDREMDKRFLINSYNRSWTIFDDQRVCFDMAPSRSPGADTFLMCCFSKVAGLLGLTLDIMLELFGTAGMFWPKSLVQSPGELKRVAEFVEVVSN